MSKFTRQEYEHAKELVAQLRQTADKPIEEQYLVKAMDALQIEREECLHLYRKLDAVLQDAAQRQAVLQGAQAEYTIQIQTRQNQIEQLFARLEEAEAELVAAKQHIQPPVNPNTDEVVALHERVASMREIISTHMDNNIELQRRLEESNKMNHDLREELLQALDKVSDKLDVEYVLPERIVVNAESFDRLTHAIENPREPNAMLISMFHKLDKEDDMISKLEYEKVVLETSNLVLKKQLKDAQDRIEQLTNQEKISSFYKPQIPPRGNK